MTDRRAALQERLRLRARVRTQAFAHLPTFGRPIEPKRTYSAAALARAASEIKADLQRDPDVQTVKVSIARPVAHLLELSFYVVPTFDVVPIEFKDTVQIAGALA